MNPIAAAGGWGLIKGLVAGKNSLRDRIGLGDFFAGPVIEEMMFRAPQIHPALSSAAFAAVHLTPAMVMHDPGFSAFRFAEVFAGGLMYDRAYKRYGFLGAVGAHFLHNAACTIGALVSPRAGSGPRSAHTTPFPLRRVVCRARAKTTRPRGRIRR